MAASIAQYAVGKTEGGTSVTTQPTPLDTAASGSTFLVISSDCNDLNTPTDNKGNTYAACGLGNQNAGNMIRGWICTDGVGGLGHYAEATKNNAGYPVFAFIEIAGALLTGAQDTGAYNQLGDDFTPFTITTTGANLAQADNLVFGVFTHGASGNDAASVGSPFTMLYQEMDTNHWWPLAIATHSTASDAPVTASFTHPAAVQTSLLIITIRSAAAASGLSNVGNIASAEAFGTPALQATIAASGVASAQAFGAPSFGAAIAPAGIASAEAMGAPSVQAALSPAGIASAEAFGSPIIGSSSLLMVGIASAEAFGVPALSAGVTLAGIASGEAFGLPTVGAVPASAPSPSGASGSSKIPRGWPYEQAPISSRERKRLKRAEEWAREQEAITERLLARPIARVSAPAPAPKPAQPAAVAAPPPRPSPAPAVEPRMTPERIALERAIDEALSQAPEDPRIAIQQREKDRIRARRKSEEEWISRAAILLLQD